MFLAKCFDRCGVKGVAKRVRQNNRLRFGRKRFFQHGNVGVPGVQFGIHKDGRRPCLKNGRNGCGKIGRGGDDFVPGLDGALAKFRRGKSRKSQQIG